MNTKEFMGAMLQELLSAVQNKQRGTLNQLKGVERNIAARELVRFEEQLEAIEHRIRGVASELNISL